MAQHGCTDPFSIANPTPNISIVKTETSSPAGSGTPITWKAVAGGGPGPLQFRFYRLARATNTWTMVQDYGPSSTYTWTPTPAEQGTYVIQAWVRRTGSTAVYDNWASSADFQISDTAPLIRSITADAGAPVPVGGPVTWTVDAIGGPGALQYQFWLYSVARDSWSLVRDYAPGNTYTWTPGDWDAGSYRIQASVRIGGSTGNPNATAATGPFDVVANTAPVVVSIARATGPTLRPGMPIVWTAKVAGGTAPLEYAFARWNSATMQYTVVQNYSWDSSYGWVPMPGEEGTYVLQVLVRRVGSTAQYESYLTTPTFVVN
jgi:hypothetical protein